MTCFAEFWYLFFCFVQINEVTCRMVTVYIPFTVKDQFYCHFCSHHLFIHPLSVWVCKCGHILCPVCETRCTCEKVCNILL